MLRKCIVWVLSLTLFIQMYTHDAVAQKNSFNPASISIKAEHLFSNLLTKDHFRLSLSGRSVIDGKVRLSISTHDYRQIFTDSFPATDLLWDNAEADIGINQKEAIIRKRMEDFFSDNSFIHPAIKIAIPFWPDNSDKATWLDIKSNKEAIGFVYHHGYEGTYAIAYSKKKKKALLYYASD